MVIANRDGFVFSNVFRLIIANILWTIFTYAGWFIVSNGFGTVIIYRMGFIIFYFGIKIFLGMKINLLVTLLIFKSYRITSYNVCYTKLLRWEKKLINVNEEKLHKKDISWADLIIIKVQNNQIQSASSIAKQCSAFQKRIIVQGDRITSYNVCYTKLLRICEQAAKLVHVSNLFHTQPQTELAERLVAHSFADRVFFGNSGAEANSYNFV